MSSLKIKNTLIGDNYPVVLMAAINLSSESFYKKSIVDWNDKSNLEQNFKKIIEDGAEIIDLGAQSSAPFNIYSEDTKISPNEEINRLKTPLRVLNDINDEIIISVDTQSSVVADYALSKGVDIINDISGLKSDHLLAKIINDYDCFSILMACDKVPGDAFKKTDLIESLLKSKKYALNAGISENKIIIDPGIGGWVKERTPEDDFRIITEIPEFKRVLNCPALLALSRKSFIGKTLNLEPINRLSGSLSATAISILYGANVIRTHDVLETLHTVRIAEKFLQFTS